MLEAGKKFEQGNFDVRQVRQRLEEGIGGPLVVPLLIASLRVSDPSGYTPQPLQEVIELDCAGKLSFPQGMQGQYILEHKEIKSSEKGVTKCSTILDCNVICFEVLINHNCVECRGQGWERPGEEDCCDHTPGSGMGT